MKPHICPFCKNDFFSENKKKFCSLKCRYDNFRGISRSYEIIQKIRLGLINSKVKKGMVKKCFKCEKLRYIFPNQLKKQKNFFCSQDCYHSWAQKENNPFWKGKFSQKSIERIKEGNRIYQKNLNSKVKKAQNELRKEWTIKNQPMNNSEIRKKHLDKMRELAKEGKLGNFGIKNGFYKKNWDDYGGHPRGMLGKKHSNDYKTKISQQSSKRWENKEYREKTITNQLKGLFKRPTSLEKQMVDIINKYNLPYKYVGDGSFLIGYKNPDFVNINGEKICIEVANTFHHKEDYEEKRINHFNQFGWKCIVFRCNKLNEKEVLGKIQKWN